MVVVGVSLCVNSTVIHSSISIDAITNNTSVSIANIRNENCHPLPMTINSVSTTIDLVMFLVRHNMSKN